MYFFPQQILLFFPPKRKNWAKFWKKIVCFLLANIQPSFLFSFFFWLKTSQKLAVQKKIENRSLWRITNFYSW